MSKYFSLMGIVALVMGSFIFFSAPAAKAGSLYVSNGGCGCCGGCGGGYGLGSFIGYPRINPIAMPLIRPIGYGYGYGYAIGTGCGCGVAPAPVISAPVAAEPVATAPVVAEPLMSAPAVTEPVSASPLCGTPTTEPAPVSNGGTVVDNAPASTTDTTVTTDTNVNAVNISGTFNGTITKN